MTTVQHVSEGTVVLSMEVTITEGSQFTLVPSEGYAGIDYGLATVDNVLEVEVSDLSDNPLVSVFADGHLSLFDGDEVAEQRTWLLSQPWVVYTYTTGHDKGETYALPVEVFAGHSIARY